MGYSKQINALPDCVEILQIEKDSDSAMGEVMFKLMSNRG